MHNPAPTKPGMFGIPKPHGWTIERITGTVAGLVVIATQLLSGRFPRLRILAGWVGANLLLNATVGWCPLSVVLNRLGVPSNARCSRGDNG